MEKTKRVTIYQVAYEAKVSLATVSRVLNNANNVSPEKVKAVNDAIFKLGFVPSNIARGLAKNSTTSVAIVLPSPNYNYISSMMNGMLDVCKIYGYTPMLFTFENPDDAVNVVTNVLSSQVEGIVVFNSELSAADLHKIIKIKLPMVLIGHDSFGNNAIVDMNYSTELFKAINNRIEGGLKKIYYLKDPQKDWHMAITFEHAIANAVSLNDKVSFESVNLSDNYKTYYDYFIDRFKKNPPNHEMYVIIRDSLGFGIINAAKDLGYKIPEDFELLSVIGTKQSIVARPTISSIDVDLYEIGSVSMRMLTKMLNGTLTENSFKFQTQYIKRESTLD